MVHQTVCDLLQAGKRPADVDEIPHSGMESSSRQATLGKSLMGIYVAGLDGQRISFLRATGRYFAKILSALILMIGFLMAAFTARKQALHDKIASTLVLTR